MVHLNQSISKMYMKVLPSSRTSILRRKESNYAEGDSTVNNDTHNTVGVDSSKEERKQCEECNTTNAKVVYRPLVSVNGSYLCDTCYKVKFPATAMCDMNENQNIIFRKYNEMDIRRTQNRLATQDDQDKYTEEEECRVCLEKGIYRKCCKRYYCNLCYYNQEQKCPGCKSSINRSGTSLTKSKPKRIAVLATWGITLFVVVVLIGIIYVFFAHNLTRPKTVWKGTCLGWFPKCDRPVCIDAVPHNTLMPTNYTFCSIDSVNKVIGRTCVIDSQLYRESDGVLGYDICMEQEDTQLSITSSKDVKNEFEDGIYIFDDNFDYWLIETDFKSVRMKSAQWLNMVNAKTSDICGYNDIQRPYENELMPYKDYDLLKKNTALVFSGVNYRYCETVDLDLRYGGRIEFYLKFAPIVGNELATECKSSFTGDIQLLYSLDNGTSWFIIKRYEVWKYRGNDFSFISENIPIQAYSKHTRFRWDQPIFDSIRDFWALDDVRVFHSFEKEWRKGNWFEGKKSEKWHIQQEIQCCLDLEQCPHLPNSLSLEICNHNFSERTNSRYRPKMVDIFVIASVCICLVKKAFNDFQTWFKNYEIPDSSKQFLPCTSNQLHKGSVSDSETQHFQLDVSRSWQLSAFMFVNAMFISGVTALIWHLLNAFDYYEKRSIQTFIYVLGLALDFVTVRSISINVLHLWPCHTKPCVKINKTYENVQLWIGDESIDILDITSIDKCSESFHFLLTICLFFSTFPLAISSILLKIFELKYEVYTVVLHILGCCLLFRSIIGPLWIVEIFHAASWIFSFSHCARDEMGRSISRPSVRHVVSNSMVLSMILYLTLLSSLESLKQSKFLIKISVGAIFIVTGSILGALLGLLRGLPIASKIHLTCWPKEGFSFVNERCRMRPRIWARIFGGGMNSSQYITLQVKSQLEFMNIISGSSNNIGTISNEEVVKEG